MQLVILAAGHGRRFGGLKQLAPVGPNGEAIMDYTAAAAKDCSYDGVVLVVRESIAGEIRDHVANFFPSGLRVDYVFQGARRGTAEALAAARPAIDGPFAVANADDLYGHDALDAVHGHFASDPSGLGLHNRHVLVGYHVVRTVLTSCAVTRGLIEVSPDGALREIVEHTVRLRDDGRFDAVPLAPRGGPGRILQGSEQVSMNLWGFHPRIFAELAEALDAAPNEQSAELILPDVLGGLVSSGRDQVQVVGTSARCIGITHADDLALVQDELALSSTTALRTTRAS